MIFLEKYFFVEGKRRKFFQDSSSTPCAGTFHLLVVAFDFASSRANRVVSSVTRPPMLNSSGIDIGQGKINMSFIFDHQKKRGGRERTCPVGRKNLIGSHQCQPTFIPP
jgi:hypothetical protein